jgi:hypothetical protein
MSPESVKSAAATTHLIASWMGDHRRDARAKVARQEARCQMWKYSRREEEGLLFYVVYKQAYIHERQECTRKCMTRKETVNVMESTVLRYRADHRDHRCTW